ncbi:hypothetical protein SAMN05216419_100260 [Nitrosomonas cryotolerans]|uniref:Uncharacterized protein n=1 Tax=Nitrosomonas cryotolerans ATCC 49181 TaxID=1131553 RepID=A0A1N6GTK8_9PROT|nr:hypothetical protein SAMN05216419_100260 [Nitrosomonas cryotolerans]SIO10665.1 hypothetical protein SAMN02743940_0851 [Nitrosomonas cryotolerans ATCC 49181]
MLLLSEFLSEEGSLAGFLLDKLAFCVDFGIRGFPIREVEGESFVCNIFSIRLFWSMETLGERLDYISDPLKILCPYDLVLERMRLIMASSNFVCT